MVRRMTTLRLSEEELDDIDWMARLLQTTKTQAIRNCVTFTKTLCDTDLTVEKAVREEYIDKLPPEIRNMPLIKLLKPVPKLMKVLKIKWRRRKNGV